jgi:hypothetical protein
VIKALIQQDNIIIVNKNAPNPGPPKYIQQILLALNGEMDII